MIQHTPDNVGKPPVVLVQTWLAMSKQAGQENEYTRNRAVDLLLLVFGSLEFAERYVHNNSVENNEENKLSLIHHSG